jgi:hypothetical protein
VDVNLNERTIAYALEAVDLTGLDDEYVTGCALEGLTIDGPQTAAFPDELHLIVWVPVRTGPLARKSAQQKHRDVDVAVLGSNEFVRAADEWKILLADVIHALL